MAASRALLQGSQAPEFRTLVEEGAWGLAYRHLAVASTLCVLTGRRRLCETCTCVFCSREDWHGIRVSCFWKKGKCAHLSGPLALRHPLLGRIAPTTAWTSQTIALALLGPPHATLPANKLATLLNNLGGRLPDTTMHHTRCP